MIRARVQGFIIISRERNLPKVNPFEIVLWKQKIKACISEFRNPKSPNI